MTMLTIQKVESTIFAYENAGICRSRICSARVIIRESYSLSDEYPSRSNDFKIINMQLIV